MSLVDEIGIRYWKEERGIRVRCRKEGVRGERCSLYGRTYGALLTQPTMVRNEKGAFWSYREDCAAACTRDPARVIRVVLLSSDSNWMSALLRLSAAYEAEPHCQQEMHGKGDTLVLSLAQAEYTIPGFKAGAIRRAVTHV